MLIDWADDSTTRIHQNGDETADVAEEREEVIKLIDMAAHLRIQDQRGFIKFIGFCVNLSLLYYLGYFVQSLFK